MDSIYINLKEKNGGKGRPEFRLRMCYPHHCCPISSSLACPVKNSFHVPWCHCFAYRIIHHRLDRSLQRPLDCTRHCTFFISTIWDGELVMTRLLQGIALVGAGVILNFQSIQTYVIDTFTLHAASALAAVAFLRSLCGFGFPLFAPSMYAALGYGKGDTILACIAIIVGCPAYVSLPSNANECC